VKFKFHTHQWWDAGRFNRPVVDADGQFTGFTAYHLAGERPTDGEYSAVLRHAEKHGLEAAASFYPHRLFKYEEET
jgi:hypothetical protein